ncbi:hypothetical protein AZ602_00285 [Moraxella sp. RCAD0137]|nr:hypothetical protein AZ602_00285 [Moraxella sp. RCAD0137]
MQVSEISCRIPIGTTTVLIEVLDEADKMLVFRHRALFSLSPNRGLNIQSIREAKEQGVEAFFKFFGVQIQRKMIIFLGRHKLILKLRFKNKVVSMGYSIIQMLNRKALLAALKLKTPLALL